MYKAQHLAISRDPLANNSPILGIAPASITTASVGLHSQPESHDLGLNANNCPSECTMHVRFISKAERLGRFPERRNSEPSRTAPHDVTPFPEQITEYGAMSAPNTFVAFCHGWFAPESLPDLRRMLDHSGAIFYRLEVLHFLGTIPSTSTPVLNIAVPSRFNGSFASFLCLNGYVSDGFACLPARPIAQLYKNFMHFGSGRQIHLVISIHSAMSVVLLACSTVDMAIVTTWCCIVLYPTLVMELKVSLNLGMTGCLEYLNDYGITCLEEVGPIGDEIFGTRYVGDSLCYHKEFWDRTDDAFLWLAIHSWSLNLRLAGIGDPSQVV
ncbi:hypothetical protein EV421DRAFT_1985873 [Armillaria borealis]|uniref:Uncharacterized protein n=1 Tax=Armillaria borealis TaxID=47425 RepID=A0AA39M5P8_9AGAR|nr:hypothetical protein EV421DRAFT_1985873 [Armillaria borealis]